MINWGRGVGVAVGTFVAVGSGTAVAVGSASFVAVAPALCVALTSGVAVGCAPQDADSSRTANSTTQEKALPSISLPRPASSFNVAEADHITMSRS
jgi:hypothetical protein